MASTNISTYNFNHVSLRVKDIEASTKFYTEVIGMKYITSVDVASMKITLYFFAFVDSVPEDEIEKKKLVFSHSGVMELVRAWEDGKGCYCSGNEEIGKGFGHIGITVDNLIEACERFKSLGVNFAKEVKEGPINTLAFITDPDGYWIEVMENPKITGALPV